MYDEGIQKHRIYIDETEFYLYTKLSYGLAPMGQRVNKIVSWQRGGSVTVMTAISDQVEILNYDVHARSVTFDIFNFFIAPLAAIVHGKDIVLIMENVPCHKNVSQIVLYKKRFFFNLFFFCFFFVFFVFFCFCLVFL